MINNFTTEQFARLMLEDIDKAKEEILNWTVREPIKHAKNPAQATCLKRLEWKLTQLLKKCESPIEILECIKVEYNQEVFDFLVRAREANFNFEELL